MADQEKEWSPDDEVDPAKLQKEYLEIGRELLSGMRAQKAKEAAADAKLREIEEVSKPAQVLAEGFVPAFRVLTFREVSERCRKTWEEVKRICPDAPKEVQAHVFMILQQAPDDEDRGDPAPAPGEAPEEGRPT